MKKTIFVAMMAGLLSGAAFAQTSLTSESTAGLFGTEVDDYNDVNEWQNVDEGLENLFAFTNFYNSKLSLGAAHRFGSVYGSLYFDGYFPSISSTSGETGGEDDESFTASNSFTLNALAGFNNIGIQIGGTVSPNVSNTTKGDVVSESDSSTYELFAKAGINFDSIKPYALIGYYWGKTSGKNDTGAVVSETRGGYDYLNLAVGSTFALKSTETMESSASVELSNLLYFFPDNLSVFDGIVMEKQDKSRNVLTLTPAYKIVYDDGDTFRIGFNAEVPIAIRIEGEDETDASEFSIGLSPEVGVGLQYAATKKLTVNAGTTLSFSNLFGYESSEEGDDESSTLTLFKSFSLNLHTGVSYAITPKVTVDTDFTLFRTTIGNAYGTDSQYYSDYGTSLATIWNSRIGLQLSVKL